MGNYGKLWKTMENYGKLWKTMENYGPFPRSGDSMISPDLVNIL